MKSQALLITGVNRIELAEVEIPAPQGREVLIETAFSGISPGTELRGLAGRQAGCPGFPCIPGYTQSGVVLEAGPKAGMKPGQRVFCNGTTRASVPLMWGGHCCHAVRDESSVFALPDEVSLQDASIAKLAAIAQRGVTVGRAMEGECVAVIGLGPIGQLSARLHALTGARVCGVDLDSRRVERLNESGVEAIQPGSNTLSDDLEQVFPDGIDVVVDATGSTKVLEQSLLLARIKEWEDASPGPRLIIQGSYPEDFTLPYEEAFRREISIHFPRDQTSLEIEQVLQFMAAGRLQVADLVEQVVRPEDCQAVYDQLRDPDSGLLTAVFRWS